MAYQRPQFDKMTRSETEPERKLLGISRVARMMAGGRRFRFRATVAVGDGKGRVGLATGSGADVAQAVEKGAKRANKKLTNVLLNGHTIPFEVQAKFKSARVLLKPARQGRGIIAGGAVRVLCELAGIKDISAKIISRTTNKLNVARATLKAFEAFEVVERLKERSKRPKG